jgi:uncharacterized protein (TIGR03083 family)
MEPAMPSAADWIAALRSSHERFRATAETLDADQVTGPSYASEWTIAQVASHLGSGAEIFDLFLNAGLTGSPAPGGDQFEPIWDRWNSTPPAEQVANSIPANEAFVARLEGMTEDERATFALSMFGMDTDLAALAGMRLGEHALHTWDVVVALEPDATVSDDAVQLLVDRLGQTAARAGKPVEAGRFVIATSNPERTFLLDVGPEVNLVQGASGAPDVELSSEAFIRLVFGRLDPEHTPSDVKDDETLALLRRVFPGF